MAMPTLPRTCRYKGRQSAKAIEHAFPHLVDIEVPSGGLGKRLDLINEWQFQSHYHFFFPSAPNCLR